MRLDEILKRIEAAKVGAGDVQLVAVSKNVGTDEVRELYSQGQIAFGENRVQELKRKSELLRELPLKWHFIGSSLCARRCGRAATVASSRLP